MLFASSLADIADWCFGCTFFEEQLLEAIQLPVAPFAFRIVDGCHEVAGGGSPYAFFDPQPGSHQVGEGDDAEIMPDRCSQKRSRFLERTDTGHYLDLHLRRLFHRPHFIYQRGHPVDSGITRTDHCHRFTFRSVFVGLFGTCFLTLHPGIDTLGIRADYIFYKLEIIIISDDHIRLPDGR